MYIVFYPHVSTDFALTILQNGATKFEMRGKSTNDTYDCTLDDSRDRSNERDLPHDEKAVGNALEWSKSGLMINLYYTDDKIGRSSSGFSR